MTALRPLVERHEVSWVASALGEGDREWRRPASAPSGSATAPPSGSISSRTIRSVFARFYGVVANPVLWFVQHGLWELKHDPDADLDEPWSRRLRRGEPGAGRSCRRGARPAARRAVFVHDYHLYLVPALVRAGTPGGAHRALRPHPVGRPDGMVRAARRDRPSRPRGPAGLRQRRVPHGALARGFRRELRSAPGRGDEAEARSHANPIAVDAGELAALAESPAVRERRQELLAVRPEILVLRVDRTDPSKNAVRGFAAFERLLELEPKLHRRIQLVALLDPSRQEIPEYVEYRRATEARAAAVNDRFGDATGSPSASTCATTSRPRSPPFSSTTSSSSIP